jgi:hypothetical protein
MLKLPGDEFVTIELVHNPSETDVNGGTASATSSSRSLVGGTEAIEPGIGIGQQLGTALLGQSHQIGHDRDGVGLSQLAAIAARYGVELLGPPRSPA